VFFILLLDFQKDKIRHIEKHNCTEFGMGYGFGNKLATFGAKQTKLSNMLI
jgi:hypothetical protein